ncbi:MAG TPA: hypothetical protein VH353_10680 [Caulobacteraceae bacterium]|jgi:hypothetical protein|nr:hypothetical protein [Caulobacteraceae bacterium]
MADKPMVATNLIHELAGAKPCPRALVDKLTAGQLAALHAFKHEVAAAGFRLYKDVPPAEADAVVRHFLSAMLDKR